ncbi:influenza virus NS1A-binding protein homolog isoform X1 [Schistocerca americana]|uniref:influenza virus NS1A-binding protein homolog isoform X1 n=2 Tax=Schistocerca americana TaxID=7009 RepID=UPI001F4FE9C4|nr:influenza virus NS1A-binding protein homolog isoform X1 [Schistocerca americana]XP_047119188.1 influenza virus NS1A-binding protein homolog isoform X1 [Schistocerca piceifrons]
MRPTESGQFVLGEGEDTMVENGGHLTQVVDGLTFQDDKHSQRTLQALHMMRKNRHFCDVVLHVGSAEFHAHRAVLGTVSPHLFEMFTADDETKGSQRENVVTYKLNGGFEKSAIEKLIDYAYTSRLEVSNHQVKAVYLAASYLKMDRVVRECARHLIKNLSVDNCIETRSLPGIARNKSLLEQVDNFINREFTQVSQSNILLSLPCVRVEVLNQTRQEMSLVACESACKLALEWVRRQIEGDAILIEQLTEKTHLLYLALDNSLQDCSELPTGDVGDTEIVQDYKKMSKKSQANPKGRRKAQLQPAKPRVLLYSRDIGERIEQQTEEDWSLIASTKVAEHSFLALVTLNGQLATMSIALRLNQPSSPSPVNTPVPSRPSSEEKPDLYCVMANMSSVKCAVGCANLDNKLLVCGGYDRAECLKCVESYDPSTNLWITLAPMKEARGRFGIAVVNGKAFAVGGSNGSTELATVEVYNAEHHKWSQVTSLPLARCNTGVCSLGNKIYCVGGWSGQVGIRQCDVYDPENNTWTSIAPMQTGRNQAGVCSMNGLVFAAGGCDSWNCLNTVEVYDPQTNCWQFTTNMITARRGCGLTVFKGKLYAVGGSDGTHSLSSTEIYDPVEKTWTPGPSMTTPRANVGVAVIGDRLYAVGGFSGKTFLNSIEYLDATTDEWTTFVPKVLPVEETILQDHEEHLTQNGVNCDKSNQQSLDNDSENEKVQDDLKNKTEIIQNGVKESLSQGSVTAVGS